MFTAKEENRKFFTEELLDYILTVQKNLKQIEIDDSFSVVDNRK